MLYDRQKNWRGRTDLSIYIQRVERPRVVYASSVYFVAMLVRRATES
jgi:hypothetical protein